MLLGIEIGGTKLQLGVGAGDGVLVDLVRLDVDQSQGADGILRQIAGAGRELIAKYGVTAAGFGFGGPVDTVRGVAVKSHHVHGWDAFPLADWCQRELGITAVIENDCDAAALAEARYGAGRGANPVFYVTVGTGIGGGLVVDGRIYRGSGHGEPRSGISGLASTAMILRRLSRRALQVGASPRQRGNGSPLNSASVLPTVSSSSLLAARSKAAQRADGRRSSGRWQFLGRSGHGSRIYKRWAGPSRRRSH